MSPGVIRYRGYAIEDLIGKLSFAGMVWLMTRGELPTRAQSELLDAALMAAVDHGPQAPSIAIARMATTCGVGLNNAMASAMNVLGDVHGGAGEQAVALYQAVATRMSAGTALPDAAAAALDDCIAEQGKFIPGFGHRFHLATRVRHACWNWSIRRPQPAWSAANSRPSPAPSKPRSPRARARPFR